MSQLQTLPASASRLDVLGILDRDGAVILRDAASAATAAELLAELEPFVAATRMGRDDFTGRQTTRTGALVARSPATRALILDPTILGLCDAVLLPHCQRYQLNLTQVIRILPGQAAQQLHRDRSLWGSPLPGVEPMLNTIWALNRFTTANGATQVVPGSHLWPADRVAADDEIAHADMPPGSVLIYTGSVLHGGGANVSDGPRVALNITYALGWLRQEENQYLACPPHIARTLPAELQALIGYAMGTYALGYYTPPLPPGAGPEVVPPDYALRAGAETS